MKVKPVSKFLDIFLSKNIIGITLCPFGIYLRKSTPKIINHESIHWKQQVEMLVIFFYVWYLLEWFIKLFFYGGKAYYNISFEREAYNNEKNFNYLSERSHFSWLKYVFQK